MKLKKSTASTGHGTGVMQELPLRHRLARAKAGLRQRFRIGPRAKHGFYDERGRQVAAKTVRYHRHHRMDDPWALVEMWRGLFPKPKREDNATSAERGSSFGDRLQECGTAREASKFLSRCGPRGASTGTQRKWARIVRRKHEAEVAA